MAAIDTTCSLSYVVLCVQGQNLVFFYTLGNRMVYIDVFIYMFATVPCSLSLPYYFYIHVYYCSFNCTLYLMKELCSIYSVIKEI